MSLISMHGAWLSFSDAPLLDNAELHIEDNERVCLVGRNGAGKSTLMKILNREQGLDDGALSMNWIWLWRVYSRIRRVMLPEPSMTLWRKVLLNKRHTSRVITMFRSW